ncbi:MAG TPA: hypothetical protein ENJ57_00805, partial [Rhizobiales bacterium]|nr:hypothetical protein [Hyphomicrobiales bacterium]
MTPKTGRIGKFLLSSLAICFALGAGALSAGTSPAPEKSPIEVAFGVPLSNGYYGAYQQGAVFSQLRICRSYGRILNTLRSDGFSGFSQVRIDRDYIRMNANKKGQLVR